MHKYKREDHSILYKDVLHFRVTTETVSIEVILCIDSPLRETISEGMCLSQ